VLVVEEQGLEIAGRGLGGLIHGRLS
jgi:hypothetical protein